MTEYAWGEKCIPYPILDETDDLVIVDIRGSPTALPVDRIKGRLKDGDRVQVLTTGGIWQFATVSGYDQFLEVTFEDSGRVHKLSTVKNMRLAAK